MRICSQNIRNIKILRVQRESNYSGTKENYLLNFGNEYSWKVYGLKNRMTVFVWKYKLSFCLNKNQSARQ